MLTESSETHATCRTRSSQPPIKLWRLWFMTCRVGSGGSLAVGSNFAGDQEARGAPTRQVAFDGLLGRTSGSFLQFPHLP